MRTASHAFYTLTVSAALQLSEQAISLLGDLSRKQMTSCCGLFYPHITSVAAHPISTGITWLPHRIKILLHSACGSPCSIQFCSQCNSFPCPMGRHGYKGQPRNWLRTSDRSLHCSLNRKERRSCFWGHVPLLLPVLCCCEMLPPTTTPC